MAYPSWDYNKGYQLLQKLGSFWSDVFADQNKVATFLRASAHERHQTYLNFLETVASVSRFTVPVFHKEYWYLLTAKKSDAAQILSIYQADDLVYGPQSGTDPARPAGFVQVYGGEDNPFQTQFDLSLFPNLTNADFTIQNRVINPSKTWVNGLDYEINEERNTLRFRNNLFNDSSVTIRDIYDAAGVKIDEELSLWLYCGEFDLDYVYRQFGYVLGVQLQSSEFYRDLLNAFWDMHVLGPSVSSLMTMLSAAAGVPTILEPVEVVEVVRQESESWLVVTDKNVYRIPLGATPTVAVDDTVRVGASICNAIQIDELSVSNPDYSILPQMGIGPKYLSGDYFGEITFKNESVLLEYEGLDVDGKAKIKCQLGGFPGDSDAFWDSAQALGKISGQTPANLLDLRSSPVGEPVALNLPSSINPLHFLLDNFFNTNLFVIRIISSEFNDAAPGMVVFNYLREILPPHVSYVTYVELTPDLDILDLTYAGDDAEAGAATTATAFITAYVTDIAAETSEPGTATLLYEDKAVSAKSVSVTCL